MCQIKLCANSDGFNSPGFYYMRQIRTVKQILYCIFDFILAVS